MKAEISIKIDIDSETKAIAVNINTTVNETDNKTVSYLITEESIDEQDEGREVILPSNLEDGLFEGIEKRVMKHLQKYGTTFGC